MTWLDDDPDWFEMIEASREQTEWAEWAIQEAEPDDDGLGVAQPSAGRHRGD